MAEVIEVLDATLGVHFFGDDAAAAESAVQAIDTAAAAAAAAGLPHWGGGGGGGGGGFSAIAFDAATLSEARRCPSCGSGRLGLKLSRSGGFIGCSNYPECSLTRALQPLVGCCMFKRSNPQTPVSKAPSCSA